MDRARAWRLQRRRIMNDRLRDLDAHVVQAILRFYRGGPRYLRWAAEREIARRLHQTERTIRMSFRRLALHGFIRHYKLPGRDHDDPLNGTGFKVVLLWFPDVPAEFSECPDFDRRPPEERRVWFRQDPEQGQPVSSPPDPVFQALDSSQMGQPVSSDMGQPVSSKYCARGSTDGPEPDGQTPTSSSSPPAENLGPDDDDVEALEPEEHQQAELAPIAAPAEVPTVEAAPAIAEPTPPAAPAVDQAEAALAAAVETVRQAHGDDQAEAIRAAVPGIERKLQVSLPRLELAYLRACILAGIYTTAAKKAVAITATPVAYFASITPDIAANWTPVRVRTAVDGPRARIDPELAAVLDDVRAINSIDPGGKWPPGRMRDHLAYIDPARWTPQRIDRALAYQDRRGLCGERRNP
jgi:hypothetical protein